MLTRLRALAVVAAMLACAAACLPEGIACDPRRPRSTCPSDTVCAASGVCKDAVGGSGAGASSEGEGEGEGDGGGDGVRTAMGWQPFCCGLEIAVVDAFPWELRAIDGAFHYVLRNDDQEVVHGVLDGDDVVTEIVPLPLAETAPAMFFHDAYDHGGPLCVGALLSDGHKANAACLRASGWTAEEATTLLATPLPYDGEAQFAPMADGATAVAWCNGAFFAQPLGSESPADVETLAPRANGCALTQVGPGPRVAAWNAGVDGYVAALERGGTWTTTALGGGNLELTKIDAAPDGRLAFALGSALWMTTVDRFPDGDFVTFPEQVAFVVPLLVDGGAWVLLEEYQGNTDLHFLPDGAVEPTSGDLLPGLRGAWTGAALADGSIVFTAARWADDASVLLRTAQ